MIEFFIPAKPVPKARARSTRQGHFYTPKPTKEFEDLVAIFARKAMAGKEPERGPIKIVMTFMFMPPASWPKKKQRKALAGEMKHTSKPDLDNLEKSILDGMNQVAFEDDKQVFEVSKKKMYGEHDGVFVSFEAQSNDDNNEKG